MRSDTFPPLLRHRSATADSMFRIRCSRMNGIARACFAHVKGFVAREQLLTAQFAIYIP